MTVYIAEFLSLLLAACAVSLLFMRDLLASVLLLSAYSGLLAVLFALLGAVDVAFTEAVVGVGVSTVLYVALLRRVDHRELTRRGLPVRTFAVVVVLALAAVLVYSIEALHFGDPLSPSLCHVSPEYIARSEQDTATPNVVTAVLADYRGFDTLIETSVILCAAVSCILLLGRKL
jgi:multicomponent Na+:H+ antiporter subunit B